MGNSKVMKRIARLTPEERARLFQQLQQQKQQEHTSQLPIQRLDRATPLFPLSFAQQRLWFLNQLDPQSPLYNVPQALQLKGRLDVAALQHALEGLVARHETLRTTFVTVEQEPRQRIASPSPVVLPIIDLTDRPSAERDAEAQRLMTSEAQRIFDLERGPLWNVFLLRLAEQEHILLLTLHHIICDGWSAGVLIQDVAALYEAAVAGRSPQLPDLPIQYADFAQWQRHWLQGEVLDKQLAYWKQQLSDTPILQLPTDRPRPLIQTHQGAAYTTVLPRHLWKALAALSRQEGATLHMALLAAFQVLLAKYSRQDDIAIGTPMAGRNRVELEGLVGSFVNTLVFRSSTAGNPTFCELLGRVRQVALEAYSHQDLPFEKLVDEMHLERRMDHSPLFQVWCALQNAPMPSFKLPSLTFSPLEMDTETAKFDLAFFFYGTDQGLILEAEYSRDLFDAVTITRMLQHFRTLVESIVANPNQHLSDLTLLTADERHQLLVDWNPLRMNYEHALCLQQLFEVQVGQRPDAIAVTCSDQCLTYQELNRRANQLAHFLQRLGVGPESLVGIYLERSLDMLIGLVGILKTGAAYLPLDLTYPTERLCFMLTDTQAAVLLTQKNLVQKLVDVKTPLVCLDSNWEVGPIEDEDAPLNQVTIHNLAYVIYTSGSTGKPKGVAILHSNVTRLLAATQVWFHFDEQDIWTFFHSHAFDFSVWEIWGALLSGGRLVVVPYLTSRSPNVFYAMLCDECVTVLNQTPSAFQQLMQAEEEEGQTRAKALALRQVIFGGEALDLKSLQPWFERHGDERPQLVNMYGITETTVHVTYRPLTRADTQRVPSSCIGRPIPDLQVYVLDQHLQPVPIGVPGELYVGGAGLARGYLSRPELTAERFVPNPFSEERGARLYKTGDLARYLPDGDLDFLGRIDSQVKIRGFRIELGEIEAVLTKHPAIQQVLVLPREDEPGTKRLVAYFVPNQTQAPSVNELRRFLSGQLPGYMIPSAFIPLESMPLTSQGKLDRRALPPLVPSRPELAEAFVPPRTPQEKLLVEIWAKTLRVKQVGIHDNFFDLGGDSLLAVRVISAAKQAGLGLTTKHIFLHQTVAQLAQAAEAADFIPSPHTEQGIIAGELPFTSVQKYILTRDNLVNQIQYWATGPLLEATETLDPMSLEQVTQELLMHHDMLRLRLIRDGSTWRQLIAPPDQKVPFSRIDLSVQPEIEQGYMGIVSAVTNFVITSLTDMDMAQGPLFRLLFFELGPGKPHYVLPLFHHPTTDIMSWQIVVEDLETAYRQLQRGEAIQLPPKTTSIKYYAEQIAQFAKSDTLKQELDFWLSASRQATPLPDDHQLGPSNLASLDLVAGTLSPEDTQILQQLNSERLTIPDLLLTALVETLTSQFKIPSLLVDVENHGRDTPFADVDLARTVCMPTVIFPVLFERSPNPDWGDRLARVQAQLRRIPNHGLGYGVLRYLCEDETLVRSLQVMPQSEVTLNYFSEVDPLGPHKNKAALFKLIDNIKGYVQDQEGGLAFKLNVIPMIIGGRLRVEWLYSRNAYRQETIQTLAHTYLETLRALITHCFSLPRR